MSATHDNGAYVKSCYFCEKPADWYVHWKRTRHWNFVCTDHAAEYGDKVWTSWPVPYGVERLAPRAARACDRAGHVEGRTVTDNPRYVKEDYTLVAGRERVRSYWFSLPRKQTDQDFDPSIPSVFYSRERVDGGDWFTDNSSAGFSFRGHTFSVAWGSQS